MQHFALKPLLRTGNFPFIDFVSLNSVPAISSALGRVFGGFYGSVHPDLTSAGITSNHNTPILRPWQHTAAAYPVTTERKMIFFMVKFEVVSEMAVSACGAEHVAKYLDVASAAA
jgi:hypothetical protein